MKCQILFSRKLRKISSNCRLLIYPRVVKVTDSSYSTVLDIIRFKDGAQNCTVVCVEVFKAQSTQWGHVERGQFT